MVNDGHSQWQDSPYVQCAKQLNITDFHLGPRGNIHHKGTSWLQGALGRQLRFAFSCSVYLPCTNPKDTC